MRKIFAGILICLSTALIGCSPINKDTSANKMGSQVSDIPANPPKGPQPPIEEGLWVFYQGQYYKLTGEVVSHEMIGDKISNARTYLGEGLRDGDTNFLNAGTPLYTVKESDDIAYPSQSGPKVEWLLLRAMNSPKEAVWCQIGSQISLQGLSAIPSLSPAMLTVTGFSEGESFDQCTAILEKQLENDIIIAIKAKLLRDRIESVEVAFDTDTICPKVIVPPGTDHVAISTQQLTFGYWDDLIKANVRVFLQTSIDPDTCIDKAMAAQLKKQNK